MKMVHYPDWKEPHKEKWVGNVSQNLKKMLEN